MKLLFILSEYLPDSGGGIISYYADTLPRLVADGHTVDVLVVSGDSLNRPTVYIKGVQVSYLQTEFLEKFHTGFERFKLGFPTFEAFLPVAWAAYEQVNHGKGYDLVETTDFALLFAPWVISKDSPPVVISLHGSCGQLEWHENSAQTTMDADLLRLVERSSFSCAQTLYTNSDRNAQFWSETIRRRVSVLLPMYLERKNLISLSANISESGVVVGRCQSWKGTRVLCEALKMYTECRVRWIGRDMVDRQSGLVQSEILGRDYPEVVGSSLIFEKAVPHDQIQDKIASAAFLCVPSCWDVFNLTVIEAMAIGTPVICSVGAGASMLIEHGKNGFLFNPEKPTELISAIRSVLQLSKIERNQLVENAFATISDYLNPERLLAARIDYYQDVIDSLPSRQADAWLQALFLPREESRSTQNFLYAFTLKELTVAASNQLLNGIKRLIARKLGACPSEKS